MMTIRTNEFAYRGENSEKKLVISMSADINDTPMSFGVSLDMYKLSYFVERIPSVLTGLLMLSAEVYAIDRTFIRKKYSVDGWSRMFDVTFKICDADAFNQNQTRINSLLSFLTGDYWTCHFEESPEIEWIHQEDDPEYEVIEQVNLFSGGMDSLIGAIDFMESHDGTHKVYLVSHYDSKMGGPKADQQKIIEEFNQHYPNRFIWNSSVGISPHISKELTSRSRSLMFLSMAIMVAAYKSGNVVVPENGPVSLNFPLSPSRRAACSTRTTHPIFLWMLRQLLTIWHIPVNIMNPYEFKTKGEMTRNCKNQRYLLSIINLSNSCGKRGGHQFMYDNHNATHCGRCMPCMYRKAALIGLTDPTSYGISLGHLFQKPKKVSNDFYAMLNYLRREYTNADIAKELQIMGMKKSDEHFNDYIALVKRTRDELKNMLRSVAPQQVLEYVGL